MRDALAVARNEARLLRHDPVPPVILVGMPVVLMTLLSPALAAALTLAGYWDVSGAAQTVPGMACVFAFFVAGIVGFAVFREHGWRTWARQRAAGLSGTSLLTGKLIVPAALLAAQLVVLFAFGVLALDLDVTGSWAGVALVGIAYGASVLAAGIALSALASTIQQVNALTSLGAMVLGGLGGGFVPTQTLPEWVQPIAPLSPVYWAMEGYTTAILDGGGVSDVLGPLAVLAAFTAAFAGIALWKFRLDAPKRTWG